MTLPKSGCYFVRRGKIKFGDYILSEFNEWTLADGAIGFTVSGAWSYGQVCRPLKSRKRSQQQTTAKVQKPRKRSKIV
jgi:hypothetical protein